MIAVFARFRMPANTRASIQDAMAKVILTTRDEHGCIRYDCSEDVLEPDLYRVTELWTDRPALEAHAAAPHMAEWTALRAGLGMFDRHAEVFDINTGAA